MVGLRLLRLCLKLRQGFALYPQWVSPLDPDQGRVPGPFARFARYFILLYACNLLWSAILIPHSSLLTPHFSFLTPHSSFLTPHSSLKLRSSFSLAPDLFKCNRFMPIALICFLLYNIFVNIYSHLAKSRYERTLLL